MGQPLGILFSSILALFDIYGIIEGELRIEIFEKIQKIDEIRLRSMSGETIGKNKAKQPDKSKSKVVNKR